MSPVRIGILGAARIAPAGVIRPAGHQADAVVVAVAARDPARAESFARKHAIPKVAPSYAALLEDAEVDAVYNPLPNGLHAQWTLAAIAAGKHVLCEKPLTANSAEAQEVAAAAQASNLVVMEAFHYRYHPLTIRAVEIMRSGELGPLRRVEAGLSFPLPVFSDIRYQLELAGGATMDAGCYPIHMVRTLAGEEPEVIRATAKLRSEQVDRAMVADLRFPSGATGRISASMWSSSLLRFSARAWGEHGRLTMLNPLSPNIWHRLSVNAGGRKRVERFPRRHTYDYQLEAFCAAVLRGAPTLTPPSDSVANMRVIDAVYRAAGLQVRGMPEAVADNP
jgi:predicted dehydrogenase